MQYNIDLWKFINQPFRLPHKIHHCRLEDWEMIDWDCAGCKLCGKIHLCEDTTHCPVISEEGRHVCQITGFFTRRQVFTNNEFVDTVGNLSSVEPPPMKKIDPEIVNTCVREFICSDATKKSLIQEIQKRQIRIKSTFIKLVKKHKILKTSINILDLFTRTLNEISNVRKPIMFANADLVMLANKCVSKINFFCCLFFESQKNVPPVLKTRGFVIGFLYLMRTGLILFGNIEIVPCIPLLTNVLPSENHVKIIFKISTKIMTEVENFIKISVKKLSREKLLQIGFKTI